MAEPDLQTVGGILTVIAVGVGAVVAGLQSWRKSRSGDALDAAKDQAETGAISRLQRLLAEADAERDAATQRAEALLREVATLTRDLGMTQRDLTHAQREIERYKLRTQRAGGDVTDFAPLGRDEAPPR